MKKPCLLFLTLFCASFAQDITVSKDSIQVYNNPIMSFADGVLFTSHASVPVRLDSARVAIAEMDTVGFSNAISQNSLEVSWRENTPSFQMFIWTMDSVGPDLYLLTKKTFDPDSAKPLVFSGNDTTAQIFALEIGLFLFGQTKPQYPRYIRGAMSLFFSNGQVVELKLWSQDLRTGVKRPLHALSGVEASQAGVRSSAFSYRCLANGRMVPAGDRVVVQKERIPCVKVFEKK